MKTMEDRFNHILSKATLDRVRKRIRDPKKADDFVKGLYLLPKFKYKEKSENYHNYKLLKSGQQYKTAAKLHKQTSQLLRTLFLLDNRTPAPNIQDSHSELVERLEFSKGTEVLVFELMSLYSKTISILYTQTSREGRPKTSPEDQQIIRTVAFIFRITLPTLKVSHNEGTVFHDLICILFEKGNSKNTIITALGDTDYNAI